MPEGAAQARRGSGADQGAARRHAAGVAGPGGGRLQRGASGEDHGAHGGCRRGAPLHPPKPLNPEWAPAAGAAAAQLFHISFSGKLCTRLAEQRCCFSGDCQSRPPMLYSCVLHTACLLVLWLQVESTTAGLSGLECCSLAVACTMCAALTAFWCLVTFCSRVARAAGGREAARAGRDARGYASHSCSEHSWLAAGTDQLHSSRCQRKALQAVSLSHVHIFDASLAELAPHCSRLAQQLTACSAQSRPEAGQRYRGGCGHMDGIRSDDRGLWASALHAARSQCATSSYNARMPECRAWSAASAAGPPQRRRCTRRACPAQHHALTGCLASPGPQLSSTVCLYLSAWCLMGAPVGTASPVLVAATCTAAAGCRDDAEQGP